MQLPVKHRRKENHPNNCIDKCQNKKGLMELRKEKVITYIKHLKNPLTELLHFSRSEYAKCLARLGVLTIDKLYR